MGLIPDLEVAPLSKLPRSSQDLIHEAMEEDAWLHPGSDVAGFITKKVRELEAMFANGVTQSREDASQEASFSPSAMPHCSVTVPPTHLPPTCL